MIIDAISNGIVIDHISAGKAMELYNILGLDKLDCSVALLKNVSSGKLGRKDIIKIDRKAPAQAARAHHKRHSLQESALHHLR